MFLESKTCPDCKTEKPFSEFDSITIRGKPVLGSYCKPCRRIRNNITGKKHYQKNKERVLAHQAEFRKQPGYNSKHREYKKKQIENLTDGIVANWLAVKLKTTAEEVKKVPGLIETERSRLLLNRKLKEFNQDENFRMCSACYDKKPIEEFRLRTERRKGKEPYTYRSGQCKKCESIIKNSYGKK